MSASASRNARIDDILSELRRQGWRLEQGTGDGSTYRCFPPDTTKRMVVVSTRMATHNAQGVVEILRHLRHQGFEWPPPAKEKPAPIVRSVPFPPQPSPYAETVTMAEVEAVSVAEVKPAPRSTVSTSELLFLELKEAKDYADLAGAELRTSEDALSQAQDRTRDAATHYREALAELKKKKAAFDAAFSADGDS